MRGERKTVSLSLIDQAKKVSGRLNRIKHKETITQDEIDLAIAWAKGEVEIFQVLKVLENIPLGSIYHWFGTRLKEAVRTGYLVRKD